MAKAGLCESVKFKRLCEALEVPPPIAQALLEGLWAEAHRRARASLAEPRFRPVEIEVACGWAALRRDVQALVRQGFEPALDGAPTAEARRELKGAMEATLAAVGARYAEGRLLAALCDPGHGWVDNHPDGGLTIHDYWDHAPRHVLEAMRAAGVELPEGRTRRPKAAPLAESGRACQELAGVGIALPFLSSRERTGTPLGVGEPLRDAQQGQPADQPAVRRAPEAGGGIPRDDKFACRDGRVQLSYDQVERVAAGVPGLQLNRAVAEVENLRYWLEQHPRGRPTAAGLVGWLREKLAKSRNGPGSRPRATPRSREGQARSLGEALAAAGLGDVAEVVEQSLRGAVRGG